MALSSCPECGNQMSDAAKACPTCGYRKPLAVRVITIGLVALVGLLAAFSVIAWQANRKEPEQTEYTKCILSADNPKDCYPLLYGRDRSNPPQTEEP